MTSVVLLIGAEPKAVVFNNSPATGQLRNAEQANLGTFLGAVCFLAGALLLLPERTEEAGVARPAQAAGRT